MGRSVVLGERDGHPDALAAVDYSVAGPAASVPAAMARAGRHAHPPCPTKARIARTIGSSR